MDRYPYYKYTILLGAARALAHIGVHLTHSGMRPKSTESSSHRTWRPSVWICVLCWPTRPPFCSSSRPYSPRSCSSWLSTSHLHHHRSDHQGSTLHLFCLFFASGDTGYFVWGGGGGVVIVFCFVYLCFVFGVFIVLLFCSV